MSGILSDEAVQSAQQAKIALTSGKDHPVLEIPYTAIIDGRQYAGKELSLVEAKVSGLSGPELHETERLVVLQFPFSGFTIGLQIQAKITRLENSYNELVLSFTNPTASHLSQLRYILNSHIAGEIVTAADILAVADDEDKPKKQKSVENGNSFLSFLNKLVRGTVALGTVLGLATVVGWIAYDKFLVSEIPGLGTILNEGQQIRSVVSGQISRLSPNAGVGEPLAVVQSSQGEFHIISMPCDCAVDLGTTSIGDTVLTGELIATLSTDADQTFIQIVIPSAQIKKMLAGGVMEFHLADGQVLPIEPLATNTSFQNIDSSSEEVLVGLQFATPVSKELVGAKGVLKIYEPNTYEAVSKIRSSLNQLSL